jgi:hypothetical protein
MSIPVRRALRSLGSDIRAARLRRRIPMSIIAERASISRTTLDKIEKVTVESLSARTRMFFSH